MLNINLKQPGQAEDTADFSDATIQLNAPTVVANISTKLHKSHKKLSPGTLIKNRFQLVRQIGVGGMGVVYTARDHRKEEAGDLDSVVAIKLLSEALESSPNAMRMLQQECAKSQSLSHPNIVTVYDFDREGSTFFMTMEYLTGITLEEFLEEKNDVGYELDTVLPHIEGLVNGLQYAHDKGIIHSDLKPANIFVTTEDEIIILDFGIARAMGESVEELDWLWKDNEERDGGETLVDPADEDNELVAFTPSFASPEMFAGEAPSPGDDIYALACITYYLLAGKHPYGKVQADLAKEMALVPEKIEGLTDRQWKALLRGLALNTEDRIGSASEFLDGFKPPVRQHWRMATLLVSLAATSLIAYFMLKPPVIPDIFNNPLPEKPVSVEIQQEINNLLELAEINMLVGRLISPAGGNALDQYQDVLTIHPYDRKAIKGLRLVLDNIADEAEISMAGGDLKDARLLVDAGLKIHKKHKKLNLINTKLRNL